MAYRKEDFGVGEIYHVFTRGVEKRDIFLDRLDYRRFLALLTHCLPVKTPPSYSALKRMNKETLRTESGDGLVDILCYCVMKNHFHLLLRENVDGGISAYMHRLLTSYSRYFNVRNIRSGSLFVNPFKGVWIQNDEQFLHASRYIHLNPYVAGIVRNVTGYTWSSLGEYIGTSKTAISHSKLLTSMMSKSEYEDFVKDQADYEQSLPSIEYLFPDYDEFDQL